MASEVIKLNLIPKGEMPVFHASQFDTGRLITCELYRGEDAYSVPEGYTVELHCRKVDNNIVTMASTLINDNVVTFTSTEQLTACNGKNLCEVAILDEGYRIGTLNFILEVEIDPLKGGITSTSEIHNLETQVEEIVYEAVSENFYDKTEVDYLLSGKADASSVYTKTQVDSALALKADAADVYTKTQVDSALALKANAADVYTKSQTDTLLSAKANSSDVYTKSQVDTALALKANAADVYTKAETDAKIEEAIEEILPVDTAGPSAIASFTTGLALPLVECKVGITATGGNGTPDSPNPIVGYTEANITANGNVITIAFGQTVYGGVLDVTRGKVSVNYARAKISDLNWYYTSALACFNTTDLASVVKGGNIGVLCECESLLNVALSTATITANDNFIRFNLKSDGTAETGNFAVGALVLKDTDYSDVPSMLSAIGDYYVLYELETPFDIDLTPEVISAVVGTNNVFANTNGNTTVKFKDTIQNYIDKKVNT